MTEKFVLVNLKGKKAKKLAEAISNDTCRKILDYLSEKAEASASDISKSLNIPISTVDYNLKSLTQSRLIESKEFKWSPKGREMSLYKIAKKFIILTPGKFEGLGDKLKTVIPIIFVLALIGFGYMFISKPDAIDIEESPLKKFSSVQELQDYLESVGAGFPGTVMGGGMITDSVATTTSGSATSAGAPVQSSKALDFSATNIQVEGVDEADFVKNDGKYIYMIKDSQVLIIDAYPAKDAGIVSRIKSIGSYPKSLFINKDRLIVLSEGRDGGTCIKIFDISNKKDLGFVKEYCINKGSYFESRMINNYIYLIIKESVYYDDESVDIPILKEINYGNLFPKTVSEKEITPDIYYFNESNNFYVFNTVIAFDIFDEDLNVQTFMMGSSSNMYMSKDNIYITYRKQLPYKKYKTGEVISYKERDKTVIHKINVDKTEIEYIGSGEVYGHVLNQFSMDEYDDHFRIATTTGQVSRTGASSTNNIYILNNNLEIVGRLEGLAPGEKIYSARFMGEKGYLVTFKKVDPLFVIDLSNPNNPKVLGKLKIPGYSDYLHPYDENHIIGIGKDTIEAERGDFAWYQGIKMALFDVSDVENPIEKDKIIIGERGSESEVLRDHKAFLFDREKNILVLPVDEVKEIEYYHNQELFTTRDEIWRGAYVFRVSPEEGFEYRGKITHSEMEEGSYARKTQETIRRSLYMDDVLYTISGIAIKMNDINIIPDEINMISLE